MAHKTMQHFRRRPQRSTGLTLIEILIVIAILVAIGALVVVNVMPARDQSDIRLTRVQLDQIGEAIERFRLDLRRYPTEDEGLPALWNRDVLEDERDIENWSGPYLRDPIREDAWGNELIYRYPSERRGEGYYDLVSLGPDGEEGTDDDITNHDRLGDDEDGFDTFDDFGR